MVRHLKHEGALIVRGHAGSELATFLSVLAIFGRFFHARPKATIIDLTQQADALGGPAPARNLRTDV